MKAITDRHTDQLIHNIFLTTYQQIMPQLPKNDGLSKRLSLLRENALFRSLNTETRDFIVSIASRHRLTFQQLLQLTEIDIDLRMWDEPPVVEQWIELEKQVTQDSDRKAGRIIFERLRQQRLLLIHKETVYGHPARPLSRDWTKKKITTHEGNNTVFGMCPVASEKTVCCNLRTIDAVHGCGFGCNYCSIQTFYQPSDISVDRNLATKLGNISLDPQKNYHICSGQSSDSLFVGDRFGVLTALLDFARRNPNIILELKTKSKNITALLKADVPRNIFVSWSLNPQAVIDHEEYFTAALSERLAAARSVADKGILTGFHLHPMIHYCGWQSDYNALIQKVMSMFSGKEIALVSFGTLTFIKPTIKNLRMKALPSKVLQMPLEEAAGKLSYPVRIKEKMFRTVWQAFTPWHDSVFFYLCMENRELWQSVFGFCYDNNDAFEKALLRQVSGKVSQDLLGI
jgi:spore photoproduct lyase